MFVLTQGVVIWAVFGLIAIPLIAFHIWDWLHRKPETEDCGVSPICGCGLEH